MAFKINNTDALTELGIPYLWGSGDTTTTPSNEVKIKPSDGALEDIFGYSVATGDGRIVVGAPYDNDNGSDSGSAYIFNFSSNTEILKIKPTGGTSLEYFGWDVAIGSGRIVVGAYGDNEKGSDAGAAYIFDMTGTQLTKLMASDGQPNDNFGFSVDVGCNRIIIGAPYEDNDSLSISDIGAAFLFSLSGTQLVKFTGSDSAFSDRFGWSVALGCGRAVVGAPFFDGTGGFNSGAAYIFDLNGRQVAKLTPFDSSDNDNFGHSVAIGCGIVVVGSPNDDDNGSNSGSAYVYDLNGNYMFKIKASDGAAFDNFGVSVSVGSGRIVVGAYNDDGVGSDSGSAYVFDLDGRQITKITPSDAATGDVFGIDVSVYQGKIVIGAYGDDDNGSNSGSAYVYDTPQVFTPFDIAEINSYGQ